MHVQASTPRSTFRQAVINLFLRGVSQKWVVLARHIKYLAAQEILEYLCVHVCVGFCSARWVRFFLNDNKTSARKVSTITRKYSQAVLRKLFVSEFDAGVPQTKAKASGSVCEDEWMNEAIILLMLYSGVHTGVALVQWWASCSSFSYTHAVGFVDFGRTDVVAQRGHSASPALISGWKVTAVFLSGESLNRNRWSLLPETLAWVLWNQPFTRDCTVFLHDSEGIWISHYDAAE